jgi:hypothetical protein
MTGEYEARIARTIEALERNRMTVMYVPNKAAALEALEGQLEDGDVVGVGGSVTLDQIGALDLLRSGRYQFLDRYQKGLTPEQVGEVHRRCFFADAYVSSVNAVTESGELYNVDGNANRVAAITFGPRKVILVVGINKIVPDLDAAIARVKTIAAPQNVSRLHCATGCAERGVCIGVNGGMADGCRSKGRICCTYTVHGQQREEGRIRVILVGEELGY